MAPTVLFFVIALALAIYAQASLGSNVECGNLNEDSCAYAVSSNGKRCVLERRFVSCGYTCRESEIVADKLSNLIESEECINACSVNRKDLGISSDSLLERSFADSLCSDKCYRNCPNIVDLFFSVAAGEGVYLPKFCEARKSSGRREMLQVTSGAGVPTAYSPASAPLAVSAATAPAPLAVTTDATFTLEALAPSPTLEALAPSPTLEAFAPSP